MAVNYRQIKAIEAANKKLILQVCPDCPDRSGIYFLIRRENGFKWAYVGQAKKLLTRLAQHLNGYQHIDLSIKKHGLCMEENPTGWEVHFLEFPAEELDEREQYFIKKYANAGYQLRNKTTGSQGKGKQGIAPNRPSKTYYDGLEQGKKNAQKYISDLFAKHLDVTTKKKPPNKNAEKALRKFREFIGEENNNDNS